MERNHHNNEMAGTSGKSPDEGGQDPMTKASESQSPVDWFKIAEQSMILSRLLTNQRGRLNRTNL